MFCSQWSSGLAYFKIAFVMSPFLTLYPFILNGLHRSKNIIIIIYYVHIERIGLNIRHANYEATTVFACKRIHSNLLILDWYMIKRFWL